MCVPRFCVVLAQVFYAGTASLFALSSAGHAFYTVYKSEV